MAPLDDLRRRDLLPCVELAGSGAAVMVGHLDVPDLTEPGLPASLSPAAIDGLVAAVNAGRLSEARVDDALSRVLRAKQVDPCAMAASLG